MSNFEVPSPILNSPFEEPKEHWWILEGRPAERRLGRRPALYFYRDPKRETDERGGLAIEMQLVNRIRERVKAWRESGYAGVTRTSLELLQHWRREGREKRLFFAQIEAAETVIFLLEARADFRQGLGIPRDEPSEDRKAEGFAGFVRYACKMATGSGKTTVMGMVAAWSILNKVNDRSDGRFSDAVLVVVPNVTIRDRCCELDPERAEASLYRTRDLVPGHLMERLRQGRVIVTNWHVFEPQSVTTGDAAKVVRRGREVLTTETIRIGEKNDTRRGTRFLTRETLLQQIENGLIEVVKGCPEQDNALQVRSRRYVESDTALINRLLGREIGGKQNLLVMNDEAHHAYRIKRETPDEEEQEDFGETEEAEEFFKEATVWIDGLDRIHKLRGINFCLDLSATPYFLGRVGQETNRPFPWVVSDFSLMDAIESGLVKIPQLAIRDTTGAEIPGYFNIWRWILQPGRLTPAERGGKHASPKPEAVLKWAHTPIGMLAGLWEAERAAWEKNDEPRPPVFILVCKNTALANVVFDWRRALRGRAVQGQPGRSAAAARQTVPHPRPGGTRAFGDSFPAGRGLHPGGAQSRVGGLEEYSRRADQARSDSAGSAGQGTEPEQPRPSLAVGAGPRGSGEPERTSLATARARVGVRRGSNANPGLHSTARVRSAGTGPLPPDGSHCGPLRAQRGRRAAARRLARPPLRALLRLAGRGAAGIHPARCGQRRGARDSAPGDVARPRLDARGGFLDDPRRARGPQVTRQLRRGGHAQVGTAGGIFH